MTPAAPSPGASTSPTTSTHPELDSIPGGMAGDEPLRIGQRDVPTRPGALRIADCVPAQAGDHGVGVGTVRIDGYPLARPGRAPICELARSKGRLQEAAAREGEADGAGAVVAVRVERGVAAAPDVRLPHERVRGVDGVL